jgi:hypothetical protein
MTVPTTVVVPVKTAWASKIVWTSLAAPTATLLMWAGVKDISPETLAALFAGIQAAQSIATVIFRVYYNGSVTPSSIGAK